MGGPALRRDVLRWLITLNLSQPVKNVRRDFSNGFLVAEIFSQYYPQDIQMHSFDFGTKLAKKRDNWDQLEKFFRKKEFPILPGEIDNIINCGPGDGIGPLLERMYWFLARKSSKPQEPHIEDLWTGLPDSIDTSLLPDSALSPNKNSSRTADDESFYNALQNSLNNASMNFEKGSRFKDATDVSLDRIGDNWKSLDLADEACDDGSNRRIDDSLSDRKHGNIGYLKDKRPTLNAVERARQKENERLKEMSKPRIHARPELQQASPPHHHHHHRHHHQVKNNAPNFDASADPRLAFRSPNRQRQFKSYTLNDYKRQQTVGYVELGKLGPDSTEELRAKRENLEKMKEFGRSARSIVSSQAIEPRKPKNKPLSTREKALQFASTVPKPKRKDSVKYEMQENERPQPPMTELEMLEAKYQSDKQHLEAMRRDLEIFLR